MENTTALKSEILCLSLSVFGSRNNGHIQLILSNRAQHSNKKKKKKILRTVMVILSFCLFFLN